MAVMIGSARIDENGNIHGGKAGDQTGKEVAVENYYKHSLGWVVLRAKDAAVAEKIAYNMQAACDNSNIGYDQYQRNTLYTAAQKVGFDCKKVTTACETDCSALVRVCLAYAGIKVADFNTANEASVILATGKFDKITANESGLKRGDILVTASKGHTAVVLTNGKQAENTAYCGKGIGTATATSAMNIRSAPSSATSNVIGTVNKGTALEILAVNASGWMKVVWPGSAEGYAWTKLAAATYYSITIG